MKKNRILLIFIGAVSLIVFGLLLPQPIQAVLILVDSPVKTFFAVHPVLLCVVVGVLQGFFEECGYYLVFSRLLNKSQTGKIPFWFGIGRSGIHTIYDIITLILTFTSLSGFIILMISRIASFGALMKLTALDYDAYKMKRKWFLLLSIFLHAILNGTLYAAELNLIHITGDFNAYFTLIYSCVVIALIILIEKNGRE